MDTVETFAGLMDCDSVVAWRDMVFKLSGDLGYEQTLLAIFPDIHTPVEAEFSFLHSNYSADWRDRYDADKLGYVDPTVSHCLRKTTPLIWSPEIFSERKQNEMYEEACGYGIRSGVTLPIHGAKGEFGMICFVTDARPDKRFYRDAHRNIPQLCCLRDFVFESARQFMASMPRSDDIPDLTDRELECLKWCAAGKNSWEIGQILNCTEATVNFHFANLRRKFNSTSRRHVVVRAIRMGLVAPS